MAIRVGPSIEQFLRDASRADLIEAMKAIAAVLGATTTRAGMSWGEALDEARRLLDETLYGGASGE